MSLYSVRKRVLVFFAFTLGIVIVASVKFGSGSEAKMAIPGPGVTASQTVGFAPGPKLSYLPQAPDFLQASTPRPQFLIAAPVSLQSTVTVTTTTDSHAVSPAASAADGTGHISLRSAVEFVNKQTSTAASPSIINMPAGTYLLSLDNATGNQGGNGGGADDLVIGSATNLGTTLSGTTGIASDVIIKPSATAAAAGSDMIEMPLNGGGTFDTTAMALTLQNLELTGGTNAATFTGGDTNAAAGHSHLTIDNCLITGNSDATFPGGAIVNVAGDLTVTNSTFSNNTSNGAAGQGGAIYMNVPNGAGTGSHGSLSVSGSTFTNNAAAGTIAAAGGAGGAIIVLGSTQTGNAYTITKSTFDSNHATGGGAGGAIANAGSGPLTVSFSRFVNNTNSTSANGTAVAAFGSSAITANDNWWGTSVGPTGFTGNVSGGVVTAASWLQLKTSASPSTIVTNQSSALTASFLTDSANNSVTTTNLAALIGLPVSWSAVGSSISGSQSTIQASGTATATYAGTVVAGSHSATAVVDNGPASGSTNTVALTVNKAATTVALGTSGTPSVSGQSVTFTATISVTSPGSGSVTNNVTFKDNGVNIGTCAAQAVAANVATCSLNTLSVGSHPITAVYNGDSNFNASPASSLATQVVNKADTTTGMISSQNPSLTGQSVTFTATISVTSPGSGTPAGSYNFLDGGNPITGCTGISLVGNSAQCVTSALTSANHTITAAYGGDTSFNTNTGSMTGNPQVVSNQAVWSGGTSSDWNVAANWTTDAVPSASNDVLLPTSGVTNQAALPTGAVTVNNLSVASGRTLNISGGNLTINGLLTMNGGDITVNPGSLLTIGGSGSITRTTGIVIGDMKKTFAGNVLFTYPVGTSGAFSPVDVNVTAGTGDLSVIANTGTATATPPLDPTKTLQRYWTLTGSGITANVTWHYLQTDVAGTETNYKTIRVSGGSSTLMPNGAPCPGSGSPCVDTVANTIFVGGLSSFSDWTAGELAPTAAGVSVSGRVLTNNGLGLRNAIVKLTDSNGVSRQAVSSAFGYYRFDDVQSGEIYVIGVSSKRFQFSPQIVSVADDLTGLDFVATP